MSAAPDKLELFDSPRTQRVLGLVSVVAGCIFGWALICSFPASTAQQVCAWLVGLMGVAATVVGLLLIKESFRAPVTLLRADENGLLVLLGGRTNSAPVHILLLWNCVEDMEFFAMGEVGYGLRIRSSLSTAKLNNIRHNQKVEYIEKGQSLVFPVPVMHWRDHEKKMTELLLRIKQQALFNSGHMPSRPALTNGHYIRPVHLAAGA